MNSEGVKNVNNVIGLTLSNWSTPTIPERDEELEKFIQKKFDDESSIIADGEDEGHAVIYHVIFHECMRECAAFSARRAREKAIEECYALWENCRGDDSFWDKLRNK